MTDITSPVNIWSILTKASKDDKAVERLQEAMGKSRIGINEFSMTADRLGWTITFFSCFDSQKSVALRIMDGHLTVSTINETPTGIREKKEISFNF